MVRSNRAPLLPNRMEEVVPSCLDLNEATINILQTSSNHSSIFVDCTALGVELNEMGNQNDRAVIERFPEECA